MAARAVFSPAVDIYDNDKAITLLADLPGIARPDVDIMLEKRTMTIKAKRNAEPPPGYSLLHEDTRRGISNVLSLCRTRSTPPPSRLPFVTVC